MNDEITATRAGGPIEGTNVASQRVIRHNSKLDLVYNTYLLNVPRRAAASQCVTKVLPLTMLQYTQCLCASVLSTVDTQRTHREAPEALVEVERTARGHQLVVQRMDAIRADELAAVESLRSA